jgi:hypothetical protein
MAEPPGRPVEGYWVILHWRDPPHVMDLRGQFTASELRWLAAELDEHNDRLKEGAARRG